MNLFQLHTRAPGIKELSVTASTVYMEAGRLCLFLSLWDMPVGQRWLSISKHATGKGYEARLGTILLSAGVSTVPPLVSA